ncbi:hypothetical protein ACFRFJ_41670 [Streptomyces hydrogenans]|uniref:hypothetical protein n=1 Tax=Streptomyces hydrogenans TaxID=1873719 RepID=UPI0036AFE44D
MPDLSTFMNEGFGSVATAAVSLIAIPGVIIAGYIQGKNARKAGEAQAQAARDAAREQAQFSYRAALDSAKEMSREAHVQWQRDRCQEIWANFVKEVDLLGAQGIRQSEESPFDALLKAYAMVELMSPAGVLDKASTVKLEALEFNVALQLARQNVRNRAELHSRKVELLRAVEDASNLSLSNGVVYETYIDAAGHQREEQPSDPDQMDEMLRRYTKGQAAQAALDALAAVARTPDDDEAASRARTALCDFLGTAWGVAALVEAERAERHIHATQLSASRDRLVDARNAFVDEARKALDAQSP